VAYALLFGSAARGAAHSGSDLDIGLGLKRGLRLGVLELGELVSRLEGAAGPGRPARQPRELPGGSDGARGGASEPVRGLEECLALAAHWLADAGWDVPQNYGDIFGSLAEHGVVEPGLAARLAAASGLPNLVAHQYGILDWHRIHAVASTELDDLLSFCAALARRAAASP